MVQKNTQAFDDGAIDVPLDDVLAGLEGEQAGEFQANLGIEPGQVSARITNIRAVRKELPPDKNGKPRGDMRLARIDLELTDPRYAGWARRHDLPIGKRSDNDEWGDGMFRASVRRVLGEESYKANIASQPTVNAQYAKAFDLLVGKECIVNFQKSKKQQNDPTATAWPTGVLSSIDSAKTTTATATVDSGRTLL
ncbi:MAG: hypothetical protein KKB31_07935 [Nanoarchaeota archaeon]|nr:hypothetical protein [Nanoarchaeota archaeon]